MTDAPAPAAPPAAPTKPAPWGENFDPERAWRLVENLRADIASLKTERDEARKSLQERETELSTITERATNAERGLWLEKALRKHPALAEKVGEGDDAVDLSEFLKGDTEEEILRRAARLAALRSPAPPKGDTPPPSTDDGRPKPDLVPGHGGTPAPPFDPDKIAAEARRLR